MHDQPAGGDIFALLTVLAAILIATKMMGAAIQRIGQPAVLGELLAGVLLGPSLLGILHPAEPVIHALAELGVLVLLFQIGLHTDMRSILRVGAPAAVVALIGVALPFLLGILSMRMLGVGQEMAIVAAAALTATSIGISARVLSDLGTLETPEGRIVLGAAVLDDIVGLIILSVVAGLVGGAAVTVGGVAWTTTAALGFLLVTLAIGSLVIPALFRAAERVVPGGALGALALAVAFGLAAAATAARSAAIMGAFAAGLVLYRTPQRREIERATTGLGHFFVPIFFATVGASLQLGALANARGLLLGATLIAVGIVGKLVSGFAPYWFKGNRLMIGVAMIPRGEVGLIFAQMGAQTGALDDTLFSAVLLMVMATTFVAPPWLAALARREARKPRFDDERGIDELVSGAQARERPPDA